MSQREAHLYIALVFFLIFLISPASASDKITLFGGSSYWYDVNDTYGDYLHFHDTSTHINNINKRWVDLWVLHEGNIAEIKRCYAFEECDIRNIRIKIISIFYGKEAVMFQFKVLRMYK